MVINSDFISFHRGERGRENKGDTRKFLFISHCGDTYREDPTSFDGRAKSSEPEKGLMSGERRESGEADMQRTGGQTEDSGSLRRRFPTEGEEIALEASEHGENLPHNFFLVCECFASVHLRRESIHPLRKRST